MVSTACSTVAPSSSMVEIILLVRVDKILALTPLPSPSASTAMVESLVRLIFTLSPHSSSPYLFRLRYAASTCIFMVGNHAFPKILTGWQEKLLPVSIPLPVYFSSNTIMSLSLVRVTLVSAVVSPSRLAICCAATICLSMTFWAISMVSTRRR